MPESAFQKILNNGATHSGNGNNHTPTKIALSPSSLGSQRLNKVPSRLRKTSRTVSGLMIVSCFALLGGLQLVLNTLLFSALDENKATGADISHYGRDPTIPRPPLAQEVEQLQRQLFDLQSARKIYADDGNFFPFMIRDSRRLVPTQVPMGVHVFDYVDVTFPNQQKTKHASLFMDTNLIGKAVCQEYSLPCYKKKIIQVFEWVLQQFPTTQYFFYMEADNELCVPLTEIRRLAYEHQRYFITTGIGFSGWIMKREFVTDFLQELRDYVPPPKNASDILDQQGPMPCEGPDPIASVMLIEKQAWTVTRKYLVSHSILSSEGKDALTVKMPGEQPLEIDPKSGKPKKKPALEKHLPRCLEPRRSKWRISKKDPRDRFGWDYFDYNECDGEVFPCYVGQLEELLAKDMSQLNYTELDAERQKMITRQEERKRKQLLKKKQSEEKMTEQEAQGAAASEFKIVPPQGHRSMEEKLQDPATIARLEEMTERARERHAARLAQQEAASANQDPGALHVFDHVADQAIAAGLDAEAAHEAIHEAMLRQFQGLPPER